MTAARYWRLANLSGQTGGQAIIQYLTMADSRGGSTLIQTLEEYTLKSSYYDSISAAFNAFTYPTDITKFWASAADDISSSYLGFDFTTVGDVEVLYVALTADQTNYVYAPTTLRLAYSDDGSSWTGVQTFTPSSWTSGLTQMFPVSGTPGAHRYWRCDEMTNGASHNMALAGLKFFHEPPPSNIVPGPSGAFASSSYTGGTLPGNAFTYPYSSGTVWSSTPSDTVSYLGYDFGSTFSPQIMSFSITCWTTYPDYAPSTLTLAYSDDGSTYTAVQTFTPGSWSSNPTQTFMVSGAPGTHRYWRFQSMSNVHTANVIIQSVQMFDAIEANLVPSIPDPSSASSIYNSSYATINAIISGFPPWSAASADTNAYYQIDFGAGHAYDVVEITMLPWSSFPGNAPGSITLESSNDGTSFTTVATFSPATWVGGVSQTFDVGGSGPGVAGTTGFFFCV